MANRLELKDADLRALAEGSVILAFAARHAVDLNDELDLVPVGPRPGLDDSAGTGEYTGLVVGLQPAVSLTEPTASEHHVRERIPGGDAVILRVFSPEGPVLTDSEFEARRRTMEAMFQ